MMGDLTSDLALSDDDLLDKYAHAHRPGVRLSAAREGEAALCWVTSRDVLRTPAEALVLIRLHLTWGMRPDDTLTADLLARMTKEIMMTRARVLEIGASAMAARSALANLVERVGRLESKSWIRDTP